MKKLAARLILAVALMVVPVSAFALDMISDNAMESVTGQAGVSISIDEAIDMNVKVDGLSFSGSDTGFSVDMAAQPTGDGMHINISQAAGATPMTLEVKSDGNDTVITVGLPQATVLVENIPAVTLGVTDGGQKSTLGTVSVGTTTLKVNSGKVSMKML